MLNQTRIFLTLGLLATALQPACADSVLEYAVSEARDSNQRTQSVLIKNGRVMVKSAGGDHGLDLLYTQPQQKIFIIDHRKKSVMAIDEQQVSRIGQQTQEFQPLLQGLGEQIGKLSPQQRAKWEQMLGGNVSLDQIAEAAKPAKATDVVKTGLGKNVAGIACNQMHVIQGASTLAELCVADPASLNIPGEDYNTIRALLQLSERLVSKTQGLASQFGFKLPSVAFHDLAGVPVEMRDLSSRHPSSLTLTRIVTSAVSEDAMQIPQGYRSEPLTLWK